MPPSAVFIRHTTKPQQRDKVFAVWQKHMAPAVSANPDHQAYFYCFDNGNPDVIVVYQQYASAHSAAVLLQTPAYLAYLAEVEPLLQGEPEVISAAPMWSK